MITLTRPRVALERLNMELLIYPPGPKRYSRSSSQKEKASLLPALLFGQMFSVPEAFNQRCSSSQCPSRAPARAL